MLQTHEQRQVNATIQKCQNSREAKTDKNSQEITIYYYKILKIHEIIFYKITITPCYNIDYIFNKNSTIILIQATYK